MKQKIRTVAAGALLAICISCVDRSQSDPDVLAQAGDIQITRQMLDRELAQLQAIDPGLRITRDVRQRQLETLIEKILLIQEAKRLNLDTQPNFIETIQRHWEKTLITNLIQHATDGMKGDIAVTEEELQILYQLKLFRVHGRIAVFFSSQSYEDVLKKLPSAEWMDYFDINSARLPLEVKQRAMAAGPGSEPFKVEAEKKFYFVQVLEKTSNDIPGFDELREALTAECRQQKLDDAIQHWMQQLKNRTPVKYQIERL